MSPDRNLIGTWLTGWTRARAVSLPVDLGDCWRVDLDWAHQAQRFVFPRPTPELERLGRIITDPLIYLKAFITADTMRALLPPNWVIEAQCEMMRLDKLDAPPPVCPDGYRLDVDSRHARLFAGGTSVAEGQVVVEQGLAAFVGIKVDTAHRRRGLGRTVMQALMRIARDHGADEGALVATQQGRQLHATLGWRDSAPYVSAYPNIHR